MATVLPFDRSRKVKNMTEGELLSRLILPWCQHCEHDQDLVLNVEHHLCEAHADLADVLPRVIINEGESATTVDYIERCLIARGKPIYQRGPELVRPGRLDAASLCDGVARSEGSLVLFPVNESWLLRELTRVMRFVKPKFDANGQPKKNAKGGKIYTTVDPKQDHLKALLASAGEWRFPALRAITACPTFDAVSGRVIDTPGYDEASGLFLDFEPGTFAPVESFYAGPTIGDARDALGVLMQPLRTMPWVSPDDKAVALSALLTALARPSMNAAPIHLFDSPGAASGKSKICDIVGVVLTGSTLPAMSQGKTAEEDEKRLSAALRYGDPLLLIDNVQLPVEGDFLCSVATQAKVQARILGRSEKMLIPSTGLILMSGVNITAAGDVCRRVVRCRIDHGVERPDLLVFDFEPVAEARAHRAEMVTAGLTILRAYHAAGRPKPEGYRPVGSFEMWSDLVRGAIVWLGVGDPARTISDMIQADPKRDELAEVMEAWDAAYGDAEVMIADIDRDAFPPDGSSPRPGVFELHRRLVEVACRGGKWSTSAVGQWLTYRRDRVINGRRFVSGAKDRSAGGGHPRRLARVTSAA